MGTWWEAAWTWYTATMAPFWSALGAETYADQFSFLASLVTVLGGVLGLFWWRRRRAETTVEIQAGRVASPGTDIAVAAGDGSPPLVAEKVDQLTVNNTGYTIEQHDAILDKRLKELRADLKEVGEAQRALLEQKIETLETQKLDLAASYQEALATNADLSTKLDRLGGTLPEDQLEEAKTALGAGDYNLAKSLFEAIEARETQAVQRAADAAFALGEIAESEIRWSDAADHYARAAQLDPNFKTLLEATDFADKMGRIAKTSALADQLVETADSTFGESSTEFADAIAWKASALNALGRYDEADPLYRKALAITRERLGEYHPDTARHLNNLAAILNAQGQYDQAEPLYRQVLVIKRERLGENHLDTARSVNNLAANLGDQDRYDQAEPLLREALSIRRERLGENHPDTAISLNNLAYNLTAQGQYDQAEPLYRDALAIRREHLGENHPDTATILNNLALNLNAKGRYDQAEPLYCGALAIRRQRLGEYHPDTALSLNGLATNQACQGRHDEAVRLAERAVAIVEERLGAEHPDTKLYRKNLSDIREALGKD